MGYCSYSDIEKVMAQTLTTGSPNSVLTGVPGKLTTIGKKFNLNLISEDDADYYIRLADAHIDGALSQQYVTPLRESADVQMKLLVDMDAYNDTVMLDRAPSLVNGDILHFTDTNGYYDDRVTVVAVDFMTRVVTLSAPLSNLYQIDNTRVLRIKFPAPIPFVAARLAAAAIYDRYAKAQSEPGKSEYGTIIRDEGIAELNNIREGRTILFGAVRRGWRFAS